MKNIAGLLIVLLIFGCKNPYSVINKQVKEIPNFIKAKKTRNKVLNKHSFVKAVSYLPKNYVKDGTKDYTAFLQKAINENKYVLLPNFPIKINDVGLDLINNSIIIFDKKTEMRLKASNKGSYELLRIHNKENISVYEPKIKGDKYTHSASRGEWGMGISIRSSKNIEIIKPLIQECWGDGIYLGEITNKGTNYNIKIKDGFINDNRRNGISVISVDGFILKNMILSNTNGASPQAGIDFEPNYQNQKLKNIKIEDLYTYNNKSRGMLFNFNKLKGSKEAVSILVENYQNNSSVRAIGYHNIKNALGHITVKNFTSKNNSKERIYHFPNKDKGRFKVYTEEK
ncbi:hypothetical protein [Tenacibaculum finnmarkense]|uniref:hypothetical protein n=1 Tax=Tenacibaculum finnmarkense TaxID=2781243 RepID=UPI003BB6B9C4